MPHPPAAMKNGPFQLAFAAGCRACLFSVLFMSLVLAGTNSWSDSPRAVEKRTAFGTGIETAYGLHESENGNCILFRVFFISEKFFEDITRVESADGFVIRKKTKIYREFPHSLVVNIEANVYRCRGEHSDPPPLTAEGELLNSPSFHLTWKRGFELRPCDMSSIESRRPVVKAFANRWEYFLNVSAAGVPLSDHLLVDVLEKSGEKLIRLSSKL